MDILQAIGATPLVQLRRVAQSGTELLLKLEGGNPTGSVKDRMAPGVIEPAESPVLSGGQPGPHHIEGMGVGFIPPLWDPDLMDEVVAVSTADAMAMARRLAWEEAIFGGTSTGADVVAANRVATGLGPGARVVTLMADTGLKSLGTNVFRQA
jgi:cysteine synthase